MIICGFPGTGKTMMAKLHHWIDLESTPFKKNWLLYAEVARHLSNNGYNVMISTHLEVLESLEQIEAPYTVIIPPVIDKETYLARYKDRGSGDTFIGKIAFNWETWLSDILAKSSVLKTIVVLPKDGCITAWAKEMGTV